MKNHILIFMAALVIGCASSAPPRRTAIENRIPTQPPPEKVVDSSPPPYESGHVIYHPDRMLRAYDGASGRVDGGRIVQIIDQKNMLITVGDDNQTVWLTDFDTSGCADGDRFGLRINMEISGRKEYESVLGKRTVYLMRPRWTD
jgi:hypothetical protein